MDTANSFQLQNPDWNAVRSIYKKLSDEFEVLTNAYAVQLAPRTKLMLDHLIVGIDEVDQCVDELPTRAQRDELTNAMMAFFANDAKSWNHELASARLVQVIQNLKHIVHELKVTPRFIQAATNIFNYTELKRHTNDEDELINYVCMEGEATAELPLSILQIDAAHPFAVFFTKLCTLMGVADLIVDARSDFKANYISKKPGLSLYVKLNYLLIKEGISILWNFPKKLSFLFYCIRFTWSLITSKE